MAQVNAINIGVTEVQITDSVRQTSGPSIICPPQLLERIRDASVAGFISIPHGGIETAGVLFGTIDHDVIHVADFLEIPCEHAAGPSLLLSDSDQEKLASLLKTSVANPDLANLEPIGWYVSHGRRPFHIAPSDRDIHDRFFAKPRSVIALVRPHANGAADFAWFVRATDGLLHSETPDLESSVPAYISTPDTVTVPVRQANSDIDREAPSHPDPETATRRHDPLPPSAVSKRAVRTKALSIAAIACALLLASLALWRWRTPAVAAPPLRVTELGGQLRIDWDASAAGIQETNSGSLEIKDLQGRTIQIPLDSGALRSGTALYSNPSDNVEIRLRLHQRGGHDLESMIYFLSAKPARVPQPVVAREPVTVEQAAVVPEAAPEKQPEPKRAEQPPKQAKETVTHEADRVKTARFQPPPTRTRKSNMPEVQLPVPTVVNAPGVVAGPESLVGLTTNPAVIAPPTLPSKPHAATRPSFGRLIWTGRLNRNELLRLTSHGASAGWLNQPLPGFPVKISIRSAALLDGAIVVYVPSQEGLRNAEAPSKENGWNVTVYKWEPAHAHDIVVLETPAAANNWSQISVKGLNRVSMLVIDWQSM